MPALFVFLLKVNIALIVFCLGYYLVLRQLTFYTLNRVYLGIAILLSTLYPLINLDNFLQRHQQLAIPVQSVIINWKAPAEQFIQQPGYWFWATVIFWIGVVLFAGRLLIQLFSLYKLYRNSEPGNIQDHNVRLVKANISPFSFWQSIYINPDNLNPGDLQGILQHEQIHVSEWHTMDILLAEISVIFYWFNPGVWLMKKAVRENIEFITDRKILQKGMDSKAYQYSLLNVSFAATTSAGITNHFNFSTLKKRITMMNAKRSSNVNLTRYAFLLAAVLICLLTISLSKAELVKGSKVAYKTIKASVNSLATTVTTNQFVPVKKPMVLRKTDTDKKTNITVVSTRSIDGDTSKKHKFKIVNQNDSLTYYVDGKKVNAIDIKAFSPNDIATVNVTGNSGDANSISIITKATANSNSIRKSGDFSFKTADGKIVNGSITNTLSKTADGKFIIDGSITRNKDDEPISITTVDNPDVKTKNIMIRGYGNPNSKIDHVNESLVIVDGKEFSNQDLHNLSADQIESVNILAPGNKEMTEKYGDKAKNGVLKITTKKAKQ